jgi:hypothetical protein
MEERIAEADYAAEQERIAAEKAAEAARQVGEERDRKWHALMRQAEERLVESHRPAHLRDQGSSWHAAESLRRYCDAMDAAYGDRSQTAEWLAWARAYITRLDPLTAPPEIPEPPDACAEALQAHLPNGWSARGSQHGEHGSRWRV